MKGAILFEFFNNLNFFLLFLSKITNNTFIKKHSRKKTTNIQFDHDINAIKNILKSVLLVTIKVVILNAENVVYINKIIPVWIKISSYIKLGILDIFFTISAKKITTLLFQFNNRKLIPYLRLKLNDKVLTYFMKFFNLMKIKREKFTLLTKKKLNDLKIFINYMKLQIGISGSYTKSIEISLKIQFYFLINFFFSNTKVL